MIYRGCWIPGRDFWLLHALFWGDTGACLTPSISRCSFPQGRTTISRNWTTRTCARRKKRKLKLKLNGDMPIAATMRQTAWAKKSQRSCDRANLFFEYNNFKKCTFLLSDYYFQRMEDATRGEGDERLPAEVWSMIFFFAGVKATIQITLVNKRWHNICEDDSLWKLFCNQAPYSSFLSRVSQTESWKSRFQAISMLSPPPKARSSNKHR